jgi:hypothetical protein
MSRTPSLLGALAAATVALAAPAAAHATVLLDRVPHELPPRGATAAVARTPTWIVAARASTTAARLAKANGATPLRLAGTYAVPTARARAFTTSLQRRGLLRFSEPDRRLSRQSAFEGDGRETQWARGAIVAPGLTPPASPGAIGIVDDLVDAGVPDVAQAKVVKNSATRSVLGPHGTEVASAAAGQQNGTGVIGITPGAPVLTFGLKDSSCSEVSDGILAVAGQGAKVLNLSLAATEDCFLLQLAVADAFATDTLVVAAAGNEFQSGNPVVFPAAYPHVLSVGAVDVLSQPAYFSTANASIDLAAPGEDVPVAIPPAFDTRDGVRDGVTTDSGTSFAAPIVSGVASWLIGARPRLQPGQYADILRHSAKDISDPGWDSSTGFGLVDLAAALQHPTPPVDPYEPNDGITFVDGTAYTKPDPYIWTGGASRTIGASVDPVEDPVDVYRIRIPAGKRAVVRLTPSAGNADLAVYDRSAKSLQDKAVARSRRGSGRTDVVRVRNGSRKARTAYVAITAPSITTRSFDAQYKLKLSRS